MVWLIIIWATVTAIVVWPYENKIMEIEKPIVRVIARLVFAAGAPAILISGMIIGILEWIMPEDWQEDE